MKKFLLTASMLVMGIVATFAQDVPDASKWKVGEEIEGIIQNPSFTTPKAEGIVWEYKDASSPRIDEQLFESYSSGSKTQVYQYVLLPAGMYRLTCQGYYRCGSSDGDADNFANYDTQWQDNAMIFAQKGEYDQAKNTFKGANRIDQNPLMPRLFEQVQEQIYFWDDDPTPESDKGAKSWADDYQYPAAGNAWGPGGSCGSRAWFAAGKYGPYENGDVKYNMVDFLLPKASYVKIGARKVGEVTGGDTFFVTNFKLIYMGTAGDDAALLALQSEYEDLYNELAEIRDDNQGFLNEKLGDALMLLDAEYGSDPYDMNEETVEAAGKALTALKESVTKALEDMTALKNAISAIDVLVTTTGYPGKAALQEALETAKGCFAEGFDSTDKDWDTFEKYASDLYAARVDYLKSSPKVNGAWDFSPFIANRFFTNEENNPTWDEETEFWKYENWPEVWTDQEFYNNVNEDPEKTQAHQEARTAYSGDVVLDSSDDSVPFKWYKTGNNGPGWEVYYDHHMTSCKAWALTPTSGVSLIGQYLTGLPNGFYSLTGMAEYWTNDDEAAQAKSDNHFVIRSATGESRSPRAEPKAWWNGNSTDSWQFLSTDMVEVTDGTLHVEASLNGFYSITGFQLFYYGEEPNFYDMIASNISAAQEKSKELTLKGDQKKVKEMLDKISTTIPDKIAYQEAVETLAKANEYISKALACTGENWKAPGVFENLMKNLEADSPEFNFVYTAWEATGDLEDADNAVYTDAIDYDNRSQAYVAYLDFRAAVGEFLKDDAVAAVVSEQNEYLKKNFATSEKLDEFKNAIGVPYNKAKFAALGANDATLDKPVDVSYILINPSFNEGPTKGWVVEGSDPAINDEFGIEMVNGKATRTIAELWGRSTGFTFSQTVSGLPAGTYEIRAHAMYRDGWSADANGWKNYQADVEAGGEENWRNNDAILFGKGANNEWNAFVKSIYSLKETEPTFTYYVKDTDWEYDEVDQTSSPVKVTAYITGTEDKIPAAYKSFVDEANAVADGTIPFDNAVNTGEIDDDFEDIIYYFPQRTIGVVEACKKDYNNYLNKLVVYLPEGGSLELGIKQTKGNSAGSLTMDDFQLFYLGTEAPTAIDEVAEDAAAEGAVEYYSVNGVKLSAPQAGFNIVKYQDGTVKKIFIK